MADHLEVQDVLQRTAIDILVKSFRIAYSFLM